MQITRRPAAVQPTQSMDIRRGGSMRRGPWARSTSMSVELLTILIKRRCPPLMQTARPQDLLILYFAFILFYFLLFFI
jgi:hypothetical protein